MIEYTNEQIMANRRTWIDFLKEPGREKTTSKLESPTNPNARCCLGHACFILGAKRTVFTDNTGSVYDVFYNNASTYADEETVKALGLNDCKGSISPRHEYSRFKEFEFFSLANFNDLTSATSQEIGEYLETVIEGGEGTPFIKLEN